MSVTRYAAVVDALIAALQSAPALSGVAIIDGPGGAGAVPDEAVYVGWKGDPDDDAAGYLEQQYHDLGPAAMRDERVDVYVTVQVNRGDDDMSAARSRCVTLSGAIESTLRTTPTLGLSDVLRIEISDGSVRQARSSAGIGVEFDLTISATSLI
jgi:hypothetical protein